MSDFKYGLASIVDNMIDEIKKIEKRVKEERHFDIAAYAYQHINSEIEKTVKRYNENERAVPQFYDVMVTSCWISRK